MKSIALLAVGLAIAGATTFSLAQAPAAPARPAASAAKPATGKPATGKPALARIDANGDGMIDRAEAARAPRLAGQFDRLDTNKDGRLSVEERRALRDGMRDGRGPGGGMRGGPRDGRRGDLAAKMAALDTNKDGRYSRAELAGRDRLLQNFTAIDRNKDGFISREELAASHTANRGQRTPQR